MHGSLAFHEGVLFVGHHARTAHVAAFDLDGRELSSRFSFRDEEAGRSSVVGLAVDPDRRLWVADRGAERLRSFNLFGRELEGLSPRPLPPRRGSDLRSADRAGRVAQLSGVSVLAAAQVLGGASDDPLLLVLSSGTRRHGAQLFRAEDGELVESLRPLGDAQGRFAGARRATSSGRFVWIVEELARRVQVFRGMDFHYAFQPRDGRGRALDPVAAAAAPGDRLVLAVGGERPGLLLLDPAGRVERVLGLASGRGPAAEATAPPQQTAGLAGEPAAGTGVVRGRRGDPVDSGADGTWEADGVADPVDVVVAAGSDDRDTRVALLDRDGERVQVFNLEGRCYGAFPTLGSAESEEGAP